MFGKKSKTRSGEKLDSFLAAKSSFKGEMKVEGGIRIDGSYEGKIEADVVVVGKEAKITGEITAKKVVVWGYIKGNLTVHELLEIKKDGSVEGEVSTNELIVEEGGFIEGRTSKIKDSSQKVLPFENSASALEQKE